MFLVYVICKYSLLGKPQKSFDDLFKEADTKKKLYSDDDNDDDFKMSNDSDDDMVPKPGI